MAIPGMALGDLPELVRDTQLTVRFRSEGAQHYTIHVPTGRRSPKSETWVSKERLGRGGQGAVVLQEKVVEGPDQVQLRAVKTITIPGGGSQIDRALYKRELEAMAKFSQTKVCLDPFPHMPEGHASLLVPVHNLANMQLRHLYIVFRCLPELEAQDITCQILDALASMHQETFCHGDLKLANVLIVNTAPLWWVKLADFGLSKRNGVAANNTTTAKGTPNYMPPELLGYRGNPREADPYPVDMWCLGQVAFRLATGRAMFASQADLSRYFYGQTTFRSHLTQEHQLDETFVGYIESLVAPEPSIRPSTKDSSYHPWVLSTQREHPDIPDTEDEALSHDWFSDVPFSDGGGDDASAPWYTQQTTISLQESHIPQPLSANAAATSATQNEASAAWPTDTMNLIVPQNQAETLMTFYSQTPGSSSAAATVTSSTQDEASAAWPTETTTLTVPQIQTHTLTTSIDVSSEILTARPSRPLEAIFDTDVLQLEREAKKHIAAGDQYVIAGNYSQAIVEYTKAIELEPLSALHLEKRSGAYWCLSDWNRVLDNCWKALELDPKNQYALMHIFTLSIYATGQPEYALSLLDRISPYPGEKEIQEAREMKANVADARKLLDKGGDMKQVLEKLDNAESKLWSNVGPPYEWRSIRALALLGMSTKGCLRRAKPITEYLVKKRPMNVAYLILHARVQYLCGDFHLGTEHLRKARESGVKNKTDSEDINKWLAIGEKLGSLISQAKRAYEGRKPTQAAKLYTEALQVDLKNWAINAVLLHNRALCHVDMRNYSDALGDCDIALDIDPDLAVAHATKAKITSLVNGPPNNASKNVIARRELAHYRQSNNKRLNGEVETGRDDLVKTFRNLQLKEGNHSSTGAMQQFIAPVAPAASRGTTSSGDGTLNFRIEYKGREHMTKMLLNHINAEALEAHVRTILQISSVQQIKIERYSDSASAYIPLDPSDTDAYGAIHRAATVKNWLVLRVSNYVWHLQCDRCFKHITGGQHHHCDICNEGDFDVCFLCVQVGCGCVGGHQLTPRILRDGQLIVVG